jgi:ornithine cyclodeaminase/alanine dehydrogenase-like protein (mu-crystallin family)
VVLLFDAAHGRLLAIADASSITAIRTAAVSGLATRMLAREDASTLGILGAGVLALPHIAAVCAVRPITRVRLWSRSGSGALSRAQQLATRVRSEFSVAVEVCDSPAGAVRDADVVCTITAAREPVLAGAWLRSGTHVNAVGASLRSARELDTAAIARATLFTDRRESALAEAGDYLIPLAEGAIVAEHLRGDLSDLLCGRVTGRSSLDEITVFKSLGLAVEDVAALQHIYDRAVATGRGTPVELGGRRDASAH